MILMKVYREISGAVRRSVSPLRLDEEQTATVARAAILAVKAELDKLGVKDGPTWEYGEFDGRDVFVLSEKRMDDGTEVTRADGMVWRVEWSMFRGDGWLHSMVPANDPDYLVQSGALTPEQFAEAEERVASGALAEQEAQTRQGAFTGTADQIPHLATVASEFPEGWQPASVKGFMETPQDSLVGDNGMHLTPVEWLSSGRDPEPIIAILKSIRSR